MKIYSDYPLARTGQILADLIAIGLAALFVSVGVGVYSIVMLLAEFGQLLEGAGDRFEQTMADAAESLGGVPLIGDGVRAPFDSASEAGGVLADAGRSQQDLVALLAVILGIVVALIPIALLVRYWLLRRIAFARKASAAATLSRKKGGLDLLALRALATREPAAIYAIDPDPAGAWRRGDQDAIRALAGLSLRESGVRAT